MAAMKQLPVDLPVLRVIAYRLAWVLVILTFLSFAFSSLITASLINQYTASITMFVDPESVLGEVARGVAVTSSLNDQLASLQHLILSDDFLEPHVIQELGLRHDDVYIPPGRLSFMPRVQAFMESAKNQIKRLFGFEVWEQTDEQQRYLREQEMVQILKSTIRLRQSRGMLLIIEYTGLNPTTCKKVVEILANQCKELLLRTKNQETREALRYIERQYQEANQKLEELERDLANMRVEQFDKGPEAKIALLQQRERTLDDQRQIEQELETLASKKSELIEAKSKRQTELRNDPQVIAELAAIAQSQEALELNALRARLEELKKTYTPEWPEVKRVEQEIAVREQAIQSQIEQDPQAEERIFLADPIYNEYFRQITQIDTDEASLKENLERLNSNIAVYETKLKEMPEFQKSFGTIERDIALYENLQVDLAKRRETARATMELEKSRGETRIRVIARSFPNTPSGPSPILIMIALCLMGPAAGVGIIFLMYYLNNSVKSPDDVQQEYNLPVIAVIPKTNFQKTLRRHKKLLKQSSNQPLEQAAYGAGQEIENSEVELFDRMVKRVPISRAGKMSKEWLMVTMLTNPESHAAEEYRRLCFNIEWGIREALAGPCKTIQVTSALPREGKTITAVNLATTLARNHRVLLVDANFRNPSIHTVFGIPDGPGLSDLILNSTTPDLYVPAGSPNLSILPAGLSLTWPADLLSSNPMNAFVEALKQSSYFEYAVFDVPSAAAIPDAPIIASKVTGIVWVIEELRTSKEITGQALTRITNPSIFGVVLNKSEQHSLPKRFHKVWKGYQKAGSQKKRATSQ